MIAPQEIVERALAASKADATIVLVSVTHAANVRWANNTLTTNGVTTSGDVTVVSIVGDAEPRAASTTRAGLDAEGLVDLVAASNAAAAGSAPADDAAPLVTGAADPRWDTPPGSTDVGALGPLATSLAA